MSSVNLSACTDCGPRPPVPSLALLGIVVRVGGCIRGWGGGGLTGCGCGCSCGVGGCGCANVLTYTCPFNPEPEVSTLQRVVPLNTTGVLT